MAADVRNAEPSRALRILFMAANPLDTTRIAIMQEFRDVKDRLRLSKHAANTDLVLVPEVRTRDLQQALLEHEPDIVHFSGHGSSKQGIVVANGTDGQHEVEPDALADLFGILRRNIRLVVLNACFVEQQARAIVRHIDFAVGMKSAIGDGAAIEFSQALYGAIGSGCTMADAFELGRNAIHTANLAQQHVPILLNRVGSDPAATGFFPYP